MCNTIKASRPYELTMGGKWLELLKEISPDFNRVVVLMLPEVSANVEFIRAAQAAAPALGSAVCANQ
jgi:hypothetical protein